MSLVVPCRLGEVELALAMEMFVTVNASALLSLTETSDRGLTITLKRYPAVSISARIVQNRNIAMKN